MQIQVTHHKCQSLRYEVLAQQIGYWSIVLWINQPGEATSSHPNPNLSESEDLGFIMTLWYWSCESTVNQQPDEDPNQSDIDAEVVIQGLSYHLTAPLEIKDAGRKGRGVFAVDKIHKGTYLCEYRTSRVYHPKKGWIWEGVCLE